MTSVPPIPPSELSVRVARATAALGADGLDGLVLGVPENIHYLSGLDHWGYFAAHVLILTRDGRMALVARAMERVTVEAQVTNATFYGHPDTEELSDHVHTALRDLGLTRARLGIELRSLFLTPWHADKIRTGLAVEWVDGSGLIDDLRQIKSDWEIACTREAARAADLATLAATRVIRPGVSDREVAAEYHRVMILEGSEYPGFGPFIRPTRRLGEEHTTWQGDTLRHGDAVFLETCASVRRYHAPMGRLVYVGQAPEGAAKSAAISIEAMAAICDAIRPGATAGEAYAAWHRVAAAHGLGDYHRHHCGYLVGLAFPPSWTGGSAVTGLAPGSTRVLHPGMVFHVHAWFMGTALTDYFISNAVVLTETGAEVLTSRTPQDLVLCG